ncbi:thiamine pyrophosphate-binding protein [Paenibacillus thiaminolyticus]|uniref:Thiamine pyrophosphate-binding protein n=2 Tax=Paenibacillus thiaminolyticus TaxID=49283 RepID=A0A3A3GG08_PANTH|nr:thiamine pyrophosphate-binding protein [Paenibacillus thiaminolyticus]
MDGEIWGLYAKILEESGISYVFGMVGEGEGLLEAASQCSGLTACTARDQRIAVGMAMGYAQISRRPAVYTASPGPGLVNGLLGVLEAHSGSVPLIIISSGTSRKAKGTGAFQEFDSLPMMQAVTKWSYRVEHESKALWALQRAFHMAVNGRPGPVYLEIPHDLVKGPYSLDLETGPLPLAPARIRPAADLIERMSGLLHEAEKPVFIAGGGCNDNSVGALFTGLAEHYGAAMFTTASGRGVVDERHRQAFGNVGLYTLPEARALLEEADLFLVIGSQLEETALLGWEETAAGRLLIHVDCDYSSLMRSLTGELPVLGDASLTLQALLDAVPADRGQKSRDNWLERQQQAKAALIRLWGQADYERSPVRSAFLALTEFDADGVILVQDNGLHDMWGYSYPIFTSAAGRTLVPGEQTALGLPMGAALGAKLASAESSVVTIIGDGSFAMGQGALITAAERRLGITFVIINNQGYSWPRFQQAKAGYDIGCEFVLGSELEPQVRTLGGYFAKPRNHEELAAAFKEAKRRNENGNFALIEIETGWDQDLPVTVLEQYGDFQ